MWLLRKINPRNEIEFFHYTFEFEYFKHVSALHHRHYSISQPYSISNIKLQIILFLIMSSISFRKMFPFVQHSHSLLNIMN